MGVIKLQANCSDFNKNSRLMVLIILLTLIITVGKMILNYHFNFEISKCPKGCFIKLRLIILLRSFTGEKISFTTSSGGVNFS